VRSGPVRASALTSQGLFGATLIRDWPGPALARARPRYHFEARHGLGTLWLNGNLPEELGDDPEAITRLIAPYLSIPETMTAT